MDSIIIYKLLTECLFSGFKIPNGVEEGIDNRKRESDFNDADIDTIESDSNGLQRKSKKRKRQSMNGSEVSFNTEKEKFEPRIPDQNFDDIGGLENEKACYQFYLKPIFLKDYF